MARLNSVIPQRFWEHVLYMILIVARDNSVFISIHACRYLHAELRVNHGDYNNGFRTLSPAISHRRDYTMPLSCFCWYYIYNRVWVSASRRCDIWQTMAGRLVFKRVEMIIALAFLTLTADEQFIWSIQISPKIRLQRVFETSFNSCFKNN